ncbi:MAG: HAD-IA family hydrolase [Arenibacterium sp.]
MKPEAVVFDIGNVLIEWDPAKLYDPEIGPERREQLFRDVPLDDMNLDVDRGAPFRQTIYATADAHPAWRDEIRLWHDRWIEMASPVIDHSVRLLRALRRRSVPVFALSNFGVDSFELAVRHYPFLLEFDRSYISGHMKVIKPDAAIYTRAEEDCGIAPGALLFADDRPDNIDAASARGWQTHLFQGPEGWAERLVTEGLLSKEEAA